MVFFVFVAAGLTGRRMFSSRAREGDLRALAAAVTHQLPFVSASAVLMQRCRTPRPHVHPRVPAPFCHCQG